MLFKRDIIKALERYKKFPIIAILGPRQSGKTTISRMYFESYKYINLEDPQNREFAKNDPNKFLKDLENSFGVIIDEFQYVPELLSYIQIIADEKKRPGYFVLTGSQNFLMNQAITQSLAGRVGILTLLPLSLNELEKNNLIEDIDKTILNGSYARLYSEHIKTIDLYPSYIHTYIERDVRQLTNYGDILIFQKFMKLCAARVGQLLNISDLASNLGVDQRTVNKWLSVLEASYIIFLLKPHFNNFNKRLTKTPKLYFYDTGLACSLLDIKSVENLSLSSYRGSLFESLIISDFQKQYFNLGIQPSLYFWRDQNGRIEVDCLIDLGDKLISIEIKSSETISNNFFSSLKQWNEISDSQSEQNYIIYGGKIEQNRSLGKIINWKNSSNLIYDLYKKIF